MFITFEGIDGSGKSTQCELLREALDAKGLQVLLTREPGGTRTAEAIRKVLLHVHEPMEPMTEVYLYCAARNEHLEKIILPALEEDYVVISDRYYDSTIAYQGGGRSLGIGRMKEANRLFIEKCPPDLTFFIDASLDVVEKRMSHKELDRMEKEGMGFMAKVRDGYLEIIRGEPERFCVISGDQPIEEIAAQVLKKVEEKLGYAGR